MLWQWQSGSLWKGSKYQPKKHSQDTFSEELLQANNELPDGLLGIA